ncbi:MAG: hypothetical protein CME60_08125 [Halobacteriovoraceae bacterium]|nr:hypothetical protein [Halobacteriovoraceae bacterium]
MTTRKIKIILLTYLISHANFAVEVYFGENREDAFACQVSRSIKKNYPKKSLRDLRRGIKKILREDIDPYVDAHPIPAGFSLPKLVDKTIGLPGFPIDRSEYWLQNAFILYANPTLKLNEPTENYFASYLHLARKKHIQYLNGEIPKFKLRNEENIISLIEENLSTVANYQFPYRDSNGKPIVQKGKDIKDKNRFTLAIGNTNHSMYETFAHESAKYNEFASPLFLWLIDQDDYSVSPERLFDKALEIYGDPLVAIGVIPWIMSGDALTLNRSTSSLVSFKLEPLVEGHDAPGFAYHFWGYLTQAIIGNRLRVGALAYIYERLYQRDIPDWKIDALSLRVGKKIRKYFKSPEKCN